MADNSFTRAKRTFLFLNVFKNVCTKVNQNGSGFIQQLNLSFKTYTSRWALVKLCRNCFYTFRSQASSSLQLKLFKSYVDVACLTRPCFRKKKTITEIGFGTIARISKALLCVVRLSLWPEQIALTSAMKFSLSRSSSSNHC